MKGKRKVLFKLNGVPHTLILTNEATEHLKNFAETIMYEGGNSAKEEVLMAMDTCMTTYGIDGRVLWFYRNNENELEAIGFDEELELNDYARKEKHTCVSLNCPFVNHCKDYNFLVDRGEVCETQTWFFKKSKPLIENWIPCNEKLPKENEEVMLTFRNSAGAFVGEATYKNAAFYYIAECEYTTYEKVYEQPIAWQPKPKPYELTN